MGVEKVIGVDQLEQYTRTGWTVVERFETHESIYAIETTEVIDFEAQRATGHRVKQSVSKMVFKGVFPVTKFRIVEDEKSTIKSYETKYTQQETLIASLKDQLAVRDEAIKTNEQMVKNQGSLDRRLRELEERLQQ